MEKCPRYGLRKYLGLGLCAVTLGTFFMMNGQTVKADPVSTSNNEAQVVEVQKEQPQNNKGQPEETTTPVEDTSATPTQDAPAAKSTNETTEPQATPTAEPAANANKDAEIAPESETHQDNQPSTNENGASKNDVAQENENQEQQPAPAKQTKEAEAQKSQPAKAPTVPVKKAAPTKSDENIQKKVNVIYVDASGKVDPNTFFQDDLDDMTDYSSLPEMSRKEVTENVDKIDSDIASFTDKTTQDEQNKVLYQDISQYDIGSIPKNWVHADSFKGTYTYSYKVSETTEDGLTTRTNNVYVPIIHEIRRHYVSNILANASNGRITIEWPSEKYGTGRFAFLGGFTFASDDGTRTDLVTGKTINSPVKADWFFQDFNYPHEYYQKGHFIKNEQGNLVFGQKVVLPIYKIGESLKDVYDMHLAFRTIGDPFVLNYNEKDQTLTVAMKGTYSAKQLLNSTSFAFNGKITFTPKKFTNDVEFVDDTTGQKLPQFTYHMPETEVDKTAPLTGLSVPENYELATGQTLPTTYNFDAQLENGKWEVSTTPVVIHLVHAMQDLGTDTKTITRTIETINPDGSKADEDQTVTFTRDKSKDKVTGNIVYGSWNKPNGTLSEKDVAQINGYKSLVDGSAAVKVLAEMVTPESNDSKVVITYQKINNTNPGKKDDPTTPPKGEDDPTPTPPAPEPEPTNNDNTAPLPEQEPTNDTTVQPKDEKAPVKPEAAPIKNVHKVNGPVKSEQNIIKTPAKATKFTGRVVKTNVKVSPTKQTATLPQTGEKEDIAIASLGLTMATIGLLGLKKKKYLHDAN